MLKTATATLLIAGVAATPTAAVTYDAFASFNGINGAGNFSYGSITDTVLKPFSATANCASFIANTICINDGALPAAFKTKGGAFETGSVNVPGDRLLLHPGEFADAVYIAFNSTRTGTYLFNAVISSQDDGPTGIGVRGFFATGGIVHTEFHLRFRTGRVFSRLEALLDVGDSFGYIIDKNGSYRHDSTGVLATVSSVPEPATWGLMIAGFAMVGAAARRRVALTA